MHRDRENGNAPGVAGEESKVLERPNWIEKEGTPIHVAVVEFRPKNTSQPDEQIDGQHAGCRRAEARCDDLVPTKQALV